MRNNRSNRRKYKEKNRLNKERNVFRCDGCRYALNDSEIHRKEESEKKIKDRKENHYSFIDTDEVETLLTIMGYMDEYVELECSDYNSLSNKPSIEATAFGEGKVYNLQTEDIPDWAPTNPATDVMDEEF